MFKRLAVKRFMDLNTTYPIKLIDWCAEDKHLFLVCVVMVSFTDSVNTPEDRYNEVPPMAGLCYRLNFYFHVSNDTKLKRLKILLENRVYPIP